MCGIVGCFHPGATTGALAGQVAQMAATIVHRGPDAGDAWVDGQAGVAFGFRRLAILDLTAAGMQPMQSASGRYTVVFNGEIYNHHQLRAELATGHSWRGTSDTEVMLAAIDRWGLAAALPRLHGMFAIALWDAHDRSLTLVRDRLGEKPLYYGVHGGALLFGSELKALRAHPSFHAAIDQRALAEYMYASFVPSPRSIFDATWKLPAGHVVTITAGDLRSATLPQPAPYWQLHAHTRRGAASSSSSTGTTGSAGSASSAGSAEGELIDQLDALLRDAVARQMVADVPLGAFLSGGIDSSSIVALMQAQSARPVATFTIGVPEGGGLDESHFAAGVAAHLGTDHHVLQVTPAEARAVIPTLATMYDEPFADSSQIPTHLVSRLARHHVTVSLSGDGGDEVFGGYRRYLLAPRVAQRSRRLPQPVGRAGQAVLRGVPMHAWDRLRPGLGARVHQMAELLPNRGIDDVYGLVFGAPTGLGLVQGQPLAAAELFHRLPHGPRDPVDSMMYRDALTYLPDDICTKVDRASMAVSLEGRMPFLDHRVVEFAWSLPQRMLLRDGASKWALRQVLARYVPPALTERPKAGFGLPMGAWLRGPLQEWAGDLLAAHTLQAEGLLRADRVAALWAQHRRGRADHTRVLWNVLMFQSWLHSR
ncbi:MAG: asparagine synthase (glutamine-hydrolyzing) [Actinomycetota bacterium]|nr:asparagine synthase (glutamine-hydrolyzing) [Actinomycetota bacterium]